jgi:hypothetical protein
VDVAADRIRQEPGFEHRLGGADPAASEDEIRHVLAPVLPERAYTRVLG